MLTVLPHNHYPCKRLLLLFLLVSGVLSWFFYPEQFNFGGDRARYATCESIVERGTFNIDAAAGFNTIDKVYIDGHFYGCQTPLMPMIMASIYYPLNQLGLSFHQHYRWLALLFSLIFAGGSTAGSALILGKIALIETALVKRAINIALLFFFCTLYLSYSIYLNNHVFGGFLVLLGFYLIVYGKNSFSSLFLAGLAVASAAVTDPPVGFAMGAALLMYLLYKRGFKKEILFFIIGGIIPAAAHAMANVSISGSVFPVNVKPEYFNYPGSRFDETNLSGVVANTTWAEISRYAFHSLLGHRGLFSYTPLLIFAVWGSIIAFKDKEKRAKVLTAVIPTVMVLAFYIWRTKNYGGASYGVRFFLPIVPLIFWGLIFWRKDIKSRLWKILFTTAVIWSAIVAFVGSLRTASDEKVWLNSFAVNLFHYQSVHFPKYSHISWKIIDRVTGSDPKVLTYLGYWFYCVGSFTEAEEALQFSLQQKQSPDAYYWLGETALIEKDYPAALDYFRAAYKMNLSADYLKRIGFTFAFLAEYDSSSHYLLRSLAEGDSLEAQAPWQLSRANLVYYQSNERNQILARLAENYMVLGDLPQAARYLEQITETPDVVMDIYTAKVRYLLLTGETDSANRLITELFLRRNSIMERFLEDDYIAPFAKKILQETSRGRDGRR